MSNPIYHSQYTAAQIEGLIAHGAPIISNGTWWTWDIATSAYVDTGMSAEGADAWHGIADEFSASESYSAGDYVIYDGKLYLFIADHAAGAWTGTDATEVTVTGEISELAQKDPVLVAYDLVKSGDATEAARFNRIAAGVAANRLVAALAGTGEWTLFANHQTDTTTYQVEIDGRWVDVTENDEYYTFVGLQDDNTTVRSLDFGHITDGNPESPTDSYYSRQGTTALQSALTFDNTPTQNSANPVKSGGVYTSIAGVEENIADSFSTGHQFYRGDYVFYQGDLYRFTVNHKGAWNWSDVDTDTVGEALTRLQQSGVFVDKYGMFYVEE